MSMTKTAIIAAARERADAVRSGRWDDADLGVLLGMVHWSEWANILNANNVYKLRTVTATPDSDGVVAKSDLSDSTRKFYRILSLRAGNQFHSPIHYIDAPVPAESGRYGAFSWYEKGDGIQVLPIPTTTCDVTVNYRPTRASALNDGDTVDFPDGYEHVLVYGLAAEMLLKGGSETEAANDLLRRQAILREDMLSDIRRLSVRPTLMQPMDDAADWGSF